MPKIAVIMPVYNTPEEYLRQAIESILNQTYNDFEFIILNDGSTNNAKEVIQSYNDHRIKYIENEKNLGLIKTLNKGFSLCNSEFIARMDSDDISLPTRFEVQIKFFENNPQVDIIGSWVEKFPKKRIIEQPSNDEIIKLNLVFNECCIMHPSVMIRASIKPVFKEEFKHCEDYALWLSLVDSAKFENIQQVLLNYRWHSNNISKTGTFLQSLNSQYIMFQAQGKFLNLDPQKALGTLAKLKNNEKIDSKELKEIENFATTVNEKILGHSINYCLNRTAYKIMLKNCKKDFGYFKLLWTSPLNKIAEIKTWTKIENTLRFF